MEEALRRAQRAPLVAASSTAEEPYEKRAWTLRGLCRSGDPDALFVTGAAQRAVVSTMCRHCPVKQPCAADALDNHIEFGVWGGLTERQRRALLVKNPEVRSWSEFLAARRHA